LEQPDIEAKRLGEVWSRLTHWRQAAGSWQLAAGNWQLATGNSQLADGGWQRMAAKSWQLELRTDMELP